MAVRSYPLIASTPRHSSAVLSLPQTRPGTQPPPEAILDDPRLSPTSPDPIFRNSVSSLDNSLAPRNDAPEVQTNDTSTLENQVEAIQLPERLTFVSDNTPEAVIITSNLDNLDPEILSSRDDDLEQGEKRIASERVTETSFQYSECLAGRTTSNRSSPRPAESILGPQLPSPTNTQSPLKTPAPADLRDVVRDKRPSIPADTLESQIEGITSYQSPANLIDSVAILYNLNREIASLKREILFYKTSRADNGTLFQKIEIDCSRLPVFAEAP